MFITNATRNVVLGGEIIEWDIASGNTSIINEFKLLPSDKIEAIEKMPKKKRLVAIGIASRENKELAYSLEKGFNEVMTSFLENNSLDVDYDVLSIKRDAAFIVNRLVHEPKVGEFVTFIPKHTYHAYLYIKPYEFYFGHGFIDTKGLSEEKLDLHKDGILSFLSDVILLAEEATCNRKQAALNTYLSQFVLAYKNRELAFDMYREFNNLSNFRFPGIEEGQDMRLDSIDEDVFPSIDIEYNYKNIIIPVIQALC